MNCTAARTAIRTILIAAPLALGAVALTSVPALAAAPAPISPNNLSQPEEGDPPQPPVPNPDLPPGPGDVTDELPQPCEPDDVCFPPPDDDPELNPDLPPGPDDFTSEPPCPTHGDCGGGGGDGGGGSGTPGVDGPGVDASEGSDIPLPTRIDTGGGDAGYELSWVLASGAVLTATVGAAGLARRSIRGRR